VSQLHGLGGSLPRHGGGGREGRAAIRVAASGTPPRGRRTIAALLRLQRYLLAELLVSFALVLLIVTGIISAVMMIQMLHRFPELSVVALVQVVPFVLGLALTMTTPLAFLIASLLTYGRFADDNEYLAFQMGGISPRHAAAPALLAAACISIATLALTCDANPLLKGRMKAIARGQIREQVERMRSPSVTSVRINDMEMSWKDRDGDWFRDVFLTYTTETASKDGSEKTKVTNQTHAERAMVKVTDETPMRLMITLVGGNVPGRSDTLDVGRQDVVIDLGEDRADTKSKDERRSAELYYRMVRLEPALGPQRQTAAWHEWRLNAGEYWRRVAIGLAPLALAFLAVPLGLLVRSGSRAVALVVALVVALPVYYLLFQWGDNLARADVLPPALGLNLSNLVVAVAGIGMLWRVVTR
jgi:lipopolysaccharide export LptBFGC system permease protein LptF